MHTEMLGDFLHIVMQDRPPILRCNLTLDVTGVGVQRREPKCAAFWFPLTDWLAMTAIRHPEECRYSLAGQLLQLFGIENATALLPLQELKKLVSHLHGNR